MLDMLRNRSGLVLTAMTMGSIMALTLWLTQTWIVDVSKRELGHTLKAVLQTTQQAVHSWEKEQRAYANYWASSERVLNLTKSLLSVQRTPEALKALPAMTELRELLQPVIDSRGLQGFFLIAPDNITLASSRNQNIGTTNLLDQQQAFLQHIRGGASGLSLPMQSDVPLFTAEGELHSGLATMFVAAPVRDKTGEVLAILAFRIDHALLRQYSLKLPLKTTQIMVTIFQR